MDTITDLELFAVLAGRQPARSTAEALERDWRESMRGYAERGTRAGEFERDYFAHNAERA